MQVGNNLSYTKDYNTSLIYMNSNDRTPDSISATDFQISFGSTGRALSQVKKLTFTSFSTNHLFYNVASYNNTLGLYYVQVAPPGPSVPAYIVVPPNWYTAASLAAMIQATGRANIPALVSMTCSFDTTTYKFTLTSGDANYNLIIAPVVLGGGFEPRLEAALAWNMGFSILPTPESTSLTANTLPQLNIQNLYIYSTKLSPSRSYRSNNKQSSNQTNLLLSVPLNNTCYGSTVNWLSVGGSNQRGEIFYSSENQMDQMDFKICDAFGNVLEGPPNNAIAMEFFSHY
jgi:hypothetical protein